MSFLQPVIDPLTRTLQVRVELPNPDGMLRPGLFGDVILTRNASADVLTVPRSAVLDSGTRQIVLVQVGAGRFEPRKVVVGERSGELVEVRAGLRAGERVVVSANFLIDAESNLQSALDAMTASPDSATPGDHDHAVPPAAEPDHSGHPGMETPEATPEPAPDPHSAHGSHGTEH